MTTTPPAPAAERPNPPAATPPGPWPIAAHVHVSWLDFLPDALVRRARSSDVGMRVLSKLLDRNYCLCTERDVPDAPSHAWTRAAPERQLGAALGIGAAALAPLVRHAIDGRRVRELRLAFGEALYERTTNEPPLAAEPLPVDEWEACATADQYRRLAVGVGLAMMLDALRPEAPHLARRLQLLFSKDAREALARRPQPADRAGFHALVARLCLGED